MIGSSSYWGRGYCCYYTVIVVVVGYIYIMDYGRWTMDDGSECCCVVVRTVCLKIIDGRGKKYWRYPQVLYIARTVRQK